VGSYGDFAQNDATATSRNVATYNETDGSRVQVVREHSATAITHGTWTLSVTGSTVISADVQRVGMWIVNTGNARVFLRFDTTDPTSAIHHWYLDPGERYEMPYWGTELPVRMVAQAASGALTYALATVV